MHPQALVGFEPMTIHATAQHCKPFGHSLQFGINGSFDSGKLDQLKHNSQNVLTNKSKWTHNQKKNELLQKYNPIKAPNFLELLYLVDKLPEKLEIFTYHCQWNERCPLFWQSHCEMERFLSITRSHPDKTVVRKQQHISTKKNPNKKIWTNVIQPKLLPESTIVSRVNI